MTEQQYHDLDLMSYSRLKVFTEDRIKYMRLFERPTKKKKGADTPATRFGSLVDCKLLEPKSFEERFVIARNPKPSGQMGKFVEMLYELTLEVTDEDGFVTSDIDVLMEEAYNRVSYNEEGEKVAFLKKDFGKVVIDFTKGPSKYYEEMRNNTGKMLVTMKDIEKAEQLVGILKTHRVTRKLMSIETGGDYEVRNQEMIFFNVHGHECKSMVDKLFINHKKKIIQPFDLKTTYFIEGFLFNYLKYRYYIQAGLYDYAVKALAKREGLEDYTTLPMKFIAADSNCYYDPLIYTLDEMNLKQAQKGFSIDDKYFMGVDQAMNDIHWHRETNIWTSSKTNYDNLGIIPIKIFH